MIITLPFKTPTINHLYWHRGNIKILKKEAKKLRDEISEIILGQIAPTEIEALKMQKLNVMVGITENWHCKDCSVKKKDIANREKFLVDSVFAALGIDDKFIFKLTMQKQQSINEEKAIIQIEVI